LVADLKVVKLRQPGDLALATLLEVPLELAIESGSFV
jgi:hypothetical protein